MEEHIRKTQFKNLCELLKESRKKQASPFVTLQATKLRSALAGKLFRKAYQKDSVVAWRSSFVPTEMLFALDIIPFPPESIISMFANSHLTDGILKVAEDYNHSRDTCSFLRGVAGSVIKDYMPMPDFLIATSLYCQGSAQVFHSISKKFNRPFYYIDVPFHCDRHYTIDYVAKQIEDIMQKMAAVIGKELDIDRLKDAIKYSNEARNYFLKVNELRKNKPTPMLGGEAIDYSIMLSHMFGCKEMVEVCKTLHEELSERVKNKVGSIDEEKYRILWRQLRPYYSNEIFDYLERKHKAAVVFEEVNFIHWPELNPEDPFKSLAVRLLSNPPIDFSKKWLKVSIGFVKDYNVDGVVEFAQWGCRFLTANTQIVKDALQKIPVLVIDGDCIDRRDYTDAQIKTRIDAFIEILDRKKRSKR